MRRLAPLLLFAGIMLFVVVSTGPRSRGPAAPAEPPPPGAGTAPVSAAPAPREVPGESPERPIADSTGAVAGTVIGEAGALLPGARIGLPNGAVVPAPDGTWRIEGLAPGTLPVQAAAPGHPPVEAEVEIRAGEESRLDIVLRPGGLPLAGRVEDEAGAPLAGASVDVRPESPGRIALRHRVVTGPDGAFRTDGLLPGRYRLSGSAPLRIGAWHAAEAGRTDVVLTLRAAGALEVRVAGREAVEGVKFLLRTGGGELAGWWDWSEGESWTTDGLPPGVYLVYARDGEGNTARARAVVEAGARTGLVVALAPGEALRGRVVRAEDGVPVAGAVVAAAENDGPVMSGVLIDPDEEIARLNGAVTTRTDAEGRYVLAGLYAGRWLVAAHAPDLEPEVRDGVEVPGAGPDFALSRGASLAVEVRDAEGHPVPGAMVTVSVDETGGTSRDSETDHDGRCVLSGLPAGDRDLWVQVGSADWFAGRTVTVAAGERSLVVVRLPAEEAWLAGRLTRGGSPLPDRPVSVIQVEIATGTEFQVLGRTDALGRFRIGHLTAGEGALRSGESHRFGPVRRRLVLRPGENLIDLDLTGLGLVLLVVDGETRAAIPAQAGAGGAWEGTNGDGRIRLTDLPAEELEVVVVGPGYGPARIWLTPSRDPEEVRVALTPAARFTLRVEDDEGRPVADPIVEILDATGWDLGGHAEEWFTSHPLAGSRVLDLAPGSYTLRIQAPGFRPHEETLRVPVPDGVRTVTLVRE